MLFWFKCFVLFFGGILGAYAQSRASRLDSFQRAFDETEDVRVLTVLAKQGFFEEILEQKDKMNFALYCEEGIARKKARTQLQPIIDLGLGVQFFWRANARIVALDYLLKALPAIEANKDAELKYFLYGYLSKIFYEIDDWATAEKYVLLREENLFRMPAERFQKIKGRNLIDLYNTMGLIYQKRKLYDKAIPYFEKAIAYAQKYQDEVYIGITSGNVGTLYFRQGKFEQALPLLRKDVDLCVKHQVFSNSVLSLCDIARVYLAQEQYDKTQQILQETETNLAKVAYQKQEFMVFSNYYEVASLYYESQRDFENALHYRKKLDAIEKEIMAFKKEEDLKTIQFKYDYALKKHDIEALTQENEKQRFYLYLVFFSLVMVGLGLGLVVQRYRQKHKISQVLGEHNETLKQSLQQISTQAHIIEEQNQELKHINSSKDKIFSIVSHDLRSPVGSLKSVLALLKNDDLTPDELKEILPALEGNLGYAFTLMEELLYWARSQMKGIQPNPTRLNPKQVIQDTIASMQELALEKGVKLSIGIATNAPIVWADESMVKTVLRNFIANAIKFSKEAGEIIVVAYITSDNRIEFVVKDTGTGIKPENLPKLFGHEPFTTKGTADEKGTGFGLLLCKDLIKLNEGEIGAHSVWGEGSNFYFILPTIDTQEKFLQENRGGA